MSQIGSPMGGPTQVHVRLLWVPKNQSKYDMSNTKKTRGLS
jgi:hypothetical protein